MAGHATIALIVEGHGDVSAAAVLARRMLEGLSPQVRILQPHRVPKGKMRTGELGRAARYQTSRVGDGLGGVLVLVDADEDEPPLLRAELMANVDDDVRARCRVVVAVAEYEAWFLAAVESLRSHPAVSEDATFDSDPEAPLNPKSRVGDLMTVTYQETIHQAAFSALLDLDVAMSRSPSLGAFQEALLDLASGSST